MGTIRPNVFSNRELVLKRHRYAQQADCPATAGTHQMRQSLRVVGVGFVHLHVESLLSVAGTTEYLELLDAFEGY
jgi:hypothetical protein